MDSSPKVYSTVDQKVLCHVRFFVNKNPSLNHRSLNLLRSIQNTKIKMTTWIKM
jgi:hypothetical protein